MNSLIPQQQRQSWYWEQSQIGALTVHRQEPPTPQRGEAWYDEETQCLYVWDGTEWACVAAD